MPDAQFTFDARLNSFVYIFRLHPYFMHFVIYEALPLLCVFNKHTTYNSNAYGNALHIHNNQISLKIYANIAEYICIYTFGHRRAMHAAGVCVFCLAYVYKS